jgi:16S rRNA processing protein RimM
VVERVCVAQIGAAHGIKGEVKLKSFTADPQAVARYGPLESEDGSRQIVIEALRVARDHLVARLAGVRDRNAAEELASMRLYVARAALPEPAADEFYHADLIGLTAESRDGTAVATIVAIHDFGAGDLLELRPRDGGNTVMLPFTAATVPIVDIAGGRIVIDPPEGLLSKRDED